MFGTRPPPRHIVIGVFLYFFKTRLNGQHFFIDKHMARGHLHGKKETKSVNFWQKVGK